MSDGFFSNRFTIVMITTMLVISGFLFGMSWSAGNARADDPVFSSIDYNNPSTGGDRFWVSANISEAHEVYFNCTIVSLTEEVHARNLSVTNNTGTQWLIEMFVPIPIDGTSIEFNFTAWNTTDGGVGRRDNVTINIVDSIAPATVAKCYTTDQPSLKDAITVIEGTEVTFSGNSTTDNRGTGTWGNSNWKWEILPALTKQGKVQTHTFNDAGVFTVTLNASDAAGKWARDTVTVTVEMADMAPVLGPQSATYINSLKDLEEDSDYTNITLMDNGTGIDYLFNYTGPGAITFKINASGVMQDTYESDNLTGEIIDVNGTKIFQIKPKANVYFETGIVENVTLNATTAVDSLEYVIQFMIISKNDAPSFVTPAGVIVSVNEGAERTIIVEAKDTKDPQDTLTLTTNITDVITGLTAVVVNTTRDVATNAYTFKLNLTPTNDMVGDYNVSLMITDDDAGSATKTLLLVYKNITLSIKNTNDLPSFGEMKIGDTKGKVGADGEILFDIDEDVEVVVNITIVDPDLLHGEIEFDVEVEEKKNESKAEIVMVGNRFANLTFKGKVDFHGYAMVNISLSDGMDTVYQIINFTIKEVNDDPDFKRMKLQIWQTSDPDTNQYTFQLNDSNNKAVTPGAIKDGDGDAVTFKWFIKADPDGDLVFNNTWTSVKNGTNYTADLLVGLYSIWIKAEDGRGGFTVKKFLPGQINVTAIPTTVGPDDGLGILLWIIIAVAAVVVIGIIIVVVFVLIKKGKGKKKEDDELAGIPPGQPPQPGMDQFGQQQYGMGMPGQQPGMPPQPGMDQFGQQQPGMPPQQPGMDQFGQQQPGMPQPGMDQFGQQQPGMDQFGQPQPGMPQPEMDQFGQQQPGMDQFGQPQPGMPQPGMDQFGQQQPGMDQFGQQPGMPQQPGMDQFGQPQQGMPQQPGMLPQQSGMDQFGQPQQGMPQQPGMLPQQSGMDQFGQQPGMDQYGQQQYGGYDGQPQPAQPQAAPAAPVGGYGQYQQPQAYGGAPMGGGSTCPTCGAPIEPGWFLCPNCKNQI